MIHFVGAGPGAEDLITVRGRRLISEAEVIIYTGSLVNPGLLSAAREDCQIYNSAHMTLDEVVSVMCEAHGRGLSVVRLHTGDPCLYGAVKEQMDLLEEKGIPYASCPGVSSFCGAASSLNLEYTLPGVSQTVIITRMEGRTAVPEGESVEALAAHHATMVFFLSAGMLKELCRRLIKGGYSLDTPAAIVYRATWEEEEKYVCTVGELEQTAREHGITKTAIIIVGDVAAHSHYERSKLYDASFETGYRAASQSPEK